MSIKVIEKPVDNHKEAIFRGKVPSIPSSDSYKEFLDEAVQDELNYGLQPNTRYFIEVDTKDFSESEEHNVEKEWTNYKLELIKKSRQGDEKAKERYSMAKRTSVRPNYK